MILERPRPDTRIGDVYDKLMRGEPVQIKRGDVEYLRWRYGLRLKRTSVYRLTNPDLHRPLAPH